jgi:hypothetical protein
VRALIFSLVVIPSYIVFALGLMLFSAVATRVTGARTPADTEMRIADLGWPLMKWVQYMVAIEFGDDVVIGGEVHLSGHTVEGGLVKTAGVRLGHDVTVGLGSVIDIGVEVGPHGQIGAMSLVPKHTKLPAGSIYAGIPVRRLG